MFDGVPVWHASIAVKKDYSGPPREAIKTPEIVVKEIRTCGLLLLQGVGVGQTKFERGAFAFHLRRKVSPLEIAKLPDQFNNTPAVDDGGTMTLLEWIEE